MNPHDITAFFIYSGNKIDGRDVPIYFLFNPVRNCWILSDNGNIIGMFERIGRSVHDCADLMRDHNVLKNVNNEFVALFASPESVYLFNRFIKLLIEEVNGQENAILSEPVLACANAVDNQ